MDISLTTVFT